MTMTDAYKYVRSRRPIVSPNLNFMGQLLEFERDLQLWGNTSHPHPQTEWPGNTSLKGWRKKEDCEKQEGRRR